MAASRPGAIDGARTHARRSARDIATISQHGESAVWPAVFAQQAKQEGGIGEGGSRVWLYILFSDFGVTQVPSHF